MTTSNKDGLRFLNLSKIAELVTFGITISFTYSVLKMYIYYILLLHVPIFQFTDTSDIVTLVPTAIFWTLYVGLTQSSDPQLHYIFKMTDGETISTNKTLLYVGRTKSYWFLYNKNTHYTRSFKNDDVSKFDFDEKLK